MQPQRLTESVLIEGHGPLGRSTEMVLRPTNRPGWSVQFASLKDDKLVSPLWRGVVSHRSIPSCVEVGFYVGGRNHVLRVAEHLLALREGLGLYDGVLLVIGRNGIPFTGHAGHFLQNIRPALAPMTAPVRCWTTSDRIGPIKTPNGKGFVEFHPSSTGILRLVVSIDYPQYPEVKQQEYIWSSDRNSFDEIAWTRGELKPLFAPFVHASEHLGWPHAYAFADIARMPEDEWASQVVRHRGLDLFGELGLVCREGRLCGTCYCHCAGHREALQIVRKMQLALIEVRVPMSAAAE